MRLGLIGIGIGQSAAPRLHRLAGGHYRIDIDYPLFDLADGGDFDACLGACADRRGVNVTHPFKTRAIELVETVAPEIARLGAINTVLFDDGRPVRGASEGRLQRSCSGCPPFIAREQCRRRNEAAA